MRGRLLLFVGLLLIIGVGSSACASLPADNPMNPSYRLVTSQILEMDSALGTRGGLAALTRTSAPPALPERMSHGASIDPSASKPSQVKLNWALIGRRVSAIEAAWEDVSLELDRRQPGEPDESWNTWYVQWYRIMGTKHYFESSLDYVKAYVATKDQDNIELAVLQLTDAYVQVKEELKIPDTDSQRMVFSLTGSVVILAVLTVTASMIAHRRDRKFVRLPPMDRSNK